MLEKILGLPVSASEHAARVDRLILYVHILMVVLFVGWILFFFYTLFRFRKSNNPKADYTGVKTHTSSYLEATIAVIEVLLLVGLSIPFWSWKVSAFPTDPATVHVRVIAQQFAWNIHYPGPDGIFGRTDIKLVDEQTNPIGLDRKGDPHAKDDIVTLNQLHLPVEWPGSDRDHDERRDSQFSLPVMRVKQDAIPGMLIPIHFVPNKTSDQLREELATTVALPSTKSLDSDVTMDDYKAKGRYRLGEEGTVRQCRHCLESRRERNHGSSRRAPLPGRNRLRAALRPRSLPHEGLSEYRYGRTIQGVDARSGGLARRLVVYPTHPGRTK